MELTRKLSIAALAVLLAGAAAARGANGGSEASQRAAAVRQYALENAAPNILEHGRMISSFGSRQTGQPGCERTAEYIEQQFIEAGLENVTVKRKPVTAPIAGDASVVLPDGRRIAAWPLIPNGVQPCATPEEGLSGRLVYVGAGTLDEIKGKDLSGAILLMKYNSASNWLSLAQFGAVAAIFTEPGTTTWRQTDGKYVDLLPLNFPRVYVRGDGASALMEAASLEPTVVLHSEMSIDNVDAPYIEGYLSGTEGAAATVNLVSHFDSRSIVPGLAPGGDEAWGVAALIELARYFSENRPATNVRFIAFSANWQSHALSREYVAETYDRLGVEDRITCAVDLSTDSDGLAVDYNGAIGSYYGPDFSTIKPFFFGVAGTEDTGVVGSMEAFFGEGHKFYGGPIPLPHESSFSLADIAHLRPLTRAPRFYTPNESWEHPNALALVFQTDRVWRYEHNTPLATFEKSVVNFDRLKPQLVMLFYALDRLVEYAVSDKNIPAFPPRRWAATQLTEKGYSEVEGRVRVFSVKSAWYDKTLPRDENGNPLGDTYVYAYPYDVRYHAGKVFAFLPWPVWPQRYFHQGLQQFMTRYIVKTDDDGNYRIPSIAASSGYTRFCFLAYTLDKDGKIIYATDYGLRGDVEFSVTNMSFFTDRMQIPITVFPCGTLILNGLGTTHKFNYSQAVKDQWALTDIDRMSNELVEVPINVVKRVMRAGARTEADEYSFVQWYDTAMVFLKPDMPAEILLEATAGGDVFVLNDCDRPTDRPPGYSVAYGETKSTGFTALAILEQLGFLNEFRLAAYDKYGVRSYEAEKEHKLGSAYGDVAASAIEARDYRKALASSALGLSTEGRAYKATLGLLWDVVSTTVFYFTLLIPFSFLTERLLFPQANASRTLVVSAVIFAVFVGLLWVFHPGFKLADNIWITIISFLIVILTLPALFLIVGRGLKMIKESGEKYYKSHASEVERLGVLVAALSLAISNMRRRKLRTGLTLATITLLILALVLLTTSTSFNYTYNEPRKHLKTKTEGVLVSNTYDRKQAIYKSVYRLLDNLYSDEAIVVPREYYNYSYADTMASKRKIFITNGGYQVPLASLQILDEREPLVTGIDKAITSGRWFNAEDVTSVILSEKIAQTLRVSVGDSVTFENVALEVVGIFDGPYIDENVLDPDGRQVTPLYFADPSQGDAQNPAHFPAEDVVYLPRGLLEERQLIYTAIWGVVIKPHDRDRISTIADNVALAVPNIDVFKSIGEEVTVLSAYHKVSIRGSAFMIMPLVVAFFMVLAVMLGTVHERRREINIFSSVGLSPRHVAGMFFVESIVYAGIASVFGYFIGIIMLYIFRVAGLFPPVFYPNYLGIFVIYSVGLAMLATVSSSVYPMYIASRIANPSLERTWRIDTEPSDGHWEIDFPFIASDIHEVTGIIAFLREYVDHFSGEGMGVFTNLAATDFRMQGENAVLLRFSAWLAPFERNVTQEVTLTGSKDEERNRWNFAFDIQYLSGPTYLWLKSNKLFIDAFRKQMLIWRGFGDKMIEEYIEKGRQMLAEAAGEAGTGETK